MSPSLGRPCRDGDPVRRAAASAPQDADCIPPRRRLDRCAARTSRPRSATICGFGAPISSARRLVRVSGLPNGWVVKAVMLNGADITDVPTVFTKEHDGQLQVVLGSRLSTLEGEVRDDAAGLLTMRWSMSSPRSGRPGSMASPRTVFSDVRADGRFRVGRPTGGRYFAIAIAREGLPAAAESACGVLRAAEQGSDAVRHRRRRAADAGAAAVALAGMKR